MKKLCLYLSVIISCLMLSLTMVGCGDEDEPGVERPGVESESYSNVIGSNIILSPTSIGTGTSNITWSQGVSISNNIYTAPWESGQDPKTFINRKDSWEKVPVTIENDVITGEWFVITPVGTKVNGRYSGVKIVTYPNGPQNGVCLRVFGSASEQAVYIFIPSIESTYIAHFRFSPVSACPSLQRACTVKGDFCIIDRPIDPQQRIRVRDNHGNDPDWIDQTAIQNFNNIVLGLGGALIIGLPNSSDSPSVVCFDGACPNCYVDDHFTKHLYLRDGIATCAACQRAYDLNDRGIVTSGQEGFSLFRFEVNFNGTGVDVSNN